MAFLMLLVLTHQPMLGAVTCVGGQRRSFALNDYVTLGQTFTAEERFNVLWLVAPSWHDSEGGFTLRLWDSPQKRRLFAEREFVNFPDNATLCLYLPQPLPPGRYYWEISDRVGRTKVGLYGAVGSRYEGGCAYFDGRPDPKVDFLSGFFFTPIIWQGRRLSLTSRRKLERGEPLVPPNSPKWIWFPEPIPASWKTRFFRRKFRLPSRPLKATLEITGDDSYTLFVNGKEVGRGGQPMVDEFDLTDLLREGENVLAVSVRNAIPPAGLIARLKVALPGGRKITILTDEGWLSSIEAPEGWTKVKFDDSRWRPAKIVGDATSGPWFKHGNVWKLAGIEVPQGLLKRLAEEPPLRAEVRTVGGVPRLFVNGRPLLPLFFWSTNQPEFSQDWPLAGGHLYLLLYDLRHGWRPKGFDFRGLLYQALLILARDPEALFLLRVHLHPPPWWIERHKSDLIEYADKAPRHDRFGSTIEPSVASEAFKHQAGRALRELVRFLEGSPVGSRLIGYHV
ncbi:MAG TPA: hypothetical protein EYP65_00455, partial [Armatimonadetes bacterium]|nr:hypothetical protein [Armatimonadota bacterium]